MKTKLILFAGLAALSSALTAFAASDPEVELLKKKIEELDQKVRVLEREREIDQDSAATVAKSQPKIIIGGAGFSMASACDRSVTLALSAKKVAAAIRIMALFIAQPITMENRVSPNSYFSCF